MKKDGGSGRPDASGPYRKPSYWMAPHEGTVVRGCRDGRKDCRRHAQSSRDVLVAGGARVGRPRCGWQPARRDVSRQDPGVRRDYFSIVKGGTAPPSASPFGGTAPAIPGVVEAERFDEGGAGVAYHDTTVGNKGGSFRNTDVDIESTADAGGGYDVGWIRPGEWLQYTVNVTADAQYDLMLRLASTGSGRILHLDVDGVNATGAIQVPNTGGWQAWGTVTVARVPLRAGLRRLRISFDANGSTGGVANVNRLELTRSAATQPYGGTAVTLPGTIEAENFDEGGASVVYFDTTPGNRGGAYRQTDVDIEATTDSGGGWDIGWARLANGCSTPRT